MSDFNYDKWINILIWVTAISAIVSAFALLSFRIVSNKKSSESFKKIEEAQLKAIEDINRQKEVINEKISDAADSMISELETKTNETGVAIDKLKDETKTATEKIHSEIKSVQRMSELNKTSIINNAVRFSYNLKLNRDFYEKLDWEEELKLIHNCVNSFYYSLEISSKHNGVFKSSNLVLDIKEIVSGDSSLSITSSFSLENTRIQHHLNKSETINLNITCIFNLSTGSLENINLGDKVILKLVSNSIKTSDDQNFQEYSKISDSSTILIGGVIFRLGLENSIIQDLAIGVPELWGIQHEYIVKEKY